MTTTTFTRFTQDQTDDLESVLGKMRNEYYTWQRLAPSRFQQQGMDKCFKEIHTLELVIKLVQPKRS